MFFGRFYSLYAYKGINWMDLQRLSWCPNWDSLFGTLNI